MTPHVIALAGNPNSGKTTLFNRLTGLNQRVGNYPGVTVERRAGSVTIAGREATVIDVPGTYSLISRSRDEAVAFEVLTGRTREHPELVIVVVDASNLDRNLYLALQVLELGLPTVIALNMIDLATARGLVPDPAILSEKLGVPVVPVVASEGRGIDDLKGVIARALEDRPKPAPRAWRMSDEEEAAIALVRAAVEARATRGVGANADGEAIWLLTTISVAERSHLDDEDDPLAHFAAGSGPRGARTEAVEAALSEARAALAKLGHDFPARVIERRYEVASRIAEASTTVGKAPGPSITDRLDGILLHPLWGAVAFAVVMALLFQSIFAWAEPLMGFIEDTVASVQAALGGAMAEGPLRDLLTDGVVGGVGNVLVFIPQIAILFFFISVLEDSGYLARAAFITDRLMARIGLHGRAFVPLLSGFACAVPAIMATRTIESRKDRIVTILVTPLMSCSARLPIYGIVITALFSADQTVLGFLSVGGLLLLAMYVLSVTTTVAAAFVLKRTVLKSPTPPFVLELPPYRMPALSSVARRVIERCRVFVRDAGTVILACSIVLWALLYFPRSGGDSAAIEAKRTATVAQQTSEMEMAPTDEVKAQLATKHADELARLDVELSAERLRSSFAGRIGHAIEPLIAPLGFDWKIGIGILASFAAREVFVSTMGLIYGVDKAADDQSVPLREAMRAERDAKTGAPIYTPLVGLGLMVFFLLACQCMSTVAVVRRETGSWRWPVFMFAYMSVLAWVGAFVVYQGGKLLGLG
ncbi:ferrous iron transport protein B [Myxococcota bacterium]|nr:ferrous iron transport protein B [Myxococcota bacterium]